MFSQSNPIKDQILQSIHELQYCAINHIGIFNKEYSETYENFDQYKKNILPYIFTTPLNDNQLIKIQEALQKILTLLTEENRKEEDSLILNL
jgi:hypothetical protein